MTTMVTTTSPSRRPHPRPVEALAVEHLFDFALAFEPMKVYGSPFGTRIDAIVRHGTADGPRLQGEVLAGGGDWIVIGDDGIARLDVRATIRTHDGEMVHTTCTGRVVVDDAARDRFLAGETLSHDEMYARAAPLFETAADAYRWLNGTVGMGMIVELSLEHLHYQVYGLA